MSSFESTSVRVWPPRGVGGTPLVVGRLHVCVLSCSRKHSSAFIDASADGAAARRPALPRQLARVRRAARWGCARRFERAWASRTSFGRQRVRVGVLLFRHARAQHVAAPDKHRVSHEARSVAVPARAHARHARHARGRVTRAVRRRRPSRRLRAEPQPIASAAHRAGRPRPRPV
eukprot:5924792-Prymnesium_polylepis.1